MVRKCTKYQVPGRKYPPRRAGQVGVRNRTGILLDKRLACLPQAGYIVLCTWYNLANVERPTPNEECRSGDSQMGLNSARVGT
jgi:hypothetical protein